MKSIEFLTAQPNDILTFEDNGELAIAQRKDFYLVDAFIDESGEVFRTYHGYIPHCRHAEVMLWSEGGKLLLSAVVWHVPVSPLTCPMDWQDEVLTRIQGLTVNLSQKSRNLGTYVPYLVVSN